MATNFYRGTAGADTITPTTVSAGVAADPPGTKPSDNDDVIIGFGGNDDLDGGGGADRIYGGFGNDTIAAFGGGNILHGDAGNDTLSASFSNAPQPGGSDVTNSLYGDDGDDDLTIEYGRPGYSDDVGDSPTGTLSLYGGAGNDFIGVDAPEAWAGDLPFTLLATSMYGGPGDDTIQGTKVNINSDGTFDGNSADRLYGGPGNDTYRLFGPATIVEGAGKGYDTVIMRDGDFTLPANVEKLVLEDRGYYQYGWAGTGNNLDNVIIGTSYTDTLDGAGGNDRIFGGDDRDSIYGGAGNDSLAGQAGDDTLYGGLGNDHLGGGTGNDVLYGQGGGDVLTGRLGSDQLSGGGGNDRFVYETIADSLPGDGIRDNIVGFGNVGANRGDVIDLAKIDADTTKGGNQAFTFVGEADLTAPGQLRVIGEGMNSLIQGEVDGKAGADFEILVSGITAEPGDWVAQDFIL